jgi:hypothetical protein
VIEIHSHHHFLSGFRLIDDADEQRLCVYGVIGCLDQERPNVVLRVGAYGYLLRGSRSSPVIREGSAMCTSSRKSGRGMMTYLIDPSPM